MNDNITVSDVGLAFIKNYEGFREKPYLCSAKKWTIGYGTRISDAEVAYFNKTPMSRAEAEKRLKSYINSRVIPFIKKMVKVELAQYQVDALASFLYNLGEGGFWFYDKTKKRWRASTLLIKLNEKDFEGAAQEFRKWNKVGNTPLAGLTKRRLGEEKIFRGK